MRQDTPYFLGQNTNWLTQSPYPGRGIIVGRDETGNHLVQVYWIMGRSENSRNRVLSFKDDIFEHGKLSTEPADPAKIKDPSLIIYNAMSEKDHVFVVSNGHQTKDVLFGICGGKKLISSLSKYTYEPDAPNFTPRITGVCNIRSDCTFGLAILRKSIWNDSCDRLCYYYEEIRKGFGFCITTYNGNGDPPPAFTGEPLLVPLSGDIDTIANTYWNLLNEKNRVSLAVKFISPSLKSSIKVINKYNKV